MGIALALITANIFVFGLHMVTFHVRKTLHEMNSRVVTIINNIRASFDTYFGNSKGYVNKGKDLLAKFTVPSGVWPTMPPGIQFPNMPDIQVPNMTMPSLNMQG